MFKLTRTRSSKFVLSMSDSTSTLKLRAVSQTSSMRIVAKVSAVQRPPNTVFCDCSDFGKRSNYFQAAIIKLIEVVKMEEEHRMEDKASIRRLYKVRLTLASLVRQRGYTNKTLDNSLSETETFEEFEARYRADPRLVFITFKKSDVNQLLWISYEDKLVTEDKIKKLLAQMLERSINKLILVVQGDPNNNKIVEKKAKSLIEKQLNEIQSFSVELLNADDLIYDITKHELVPQHIPISFEEKQQLLKKYRMNESQLPRILVSDPIAKFLGLRQGDVVKIIRKSETAGLYVTYRIAV